MAPKNRGQGQTTPAAMPATAASQHHAVSSASSQPTKASNKPSNQSNSSASSKSPTSPSTSSSNAALKNKNDAYSIVMGIWQNYLDKTPQRTKLVDTFMAFLVVVGVLQFVYCVIAGNFPFNAFLSGFSATVGQFVLTASLRIQTNPENKADFPTVSAERAFADYVFGSMILHFFCINFIN